MADKKDNEWEDAGTTIEEFENLHAEASQYDPQNPPKVMHQPVRRYPGWRLHNSLYMSRVMCGMSQTELATKVGVTRQTISRIENRTREPSLSLGMAIAEALETKVEKIFHLKRPEFNAYEKRKR